MSSLNNLRKLTFVIQIGFVFLLFKSPIIYAQNPTAYSSPVDDLVTIKRISVLATSDNVSGIYARPIENHIKQFIDKNHHWQLVHSQSVGPIWTPEELEEDPERVKKMGMNVGADALIATRLVKGPGGITIRLSMFLAKDGKLFSFSEAKNIKKFEVEKLKFQIEELVTSLLKQVPYNGVILSRHGHRVTVNIGKRDGVTPNKVFTVIQVIKLVRHPKFNFLVKTEKEVLGKINLLKVEDTLSFGTIITEVEPGAILKDSKVVGLDFVNYNNDTLNLTDASDNDLRGRPDNKIAFGKNAFKWLPKRPPTFGKVAARVGFGSYNGSLSQTQALEASSSFYPSLQMEGELWVTPKTTIHAGFRQGIISTDNPKSGSGISELSMSLSSFDFGVGYNFRISPDIWGPQFEIIAGMSSYRLYVDDVANGLTTMKYSGMKIGVSGSFPVSKDQSWSAGANLFMFINPTLSESPGTSGSDANSSINTFSLFGAKRLGVNLQAIAKLDIELYSTNFSGSGTRTAATSASQKHTTLSGGLAYYF